MNGQITPEQLIYKIGALTIENELLRSQVDQLQQQIASLTKPQEKIDPAVTASFNSISD